MKNSSEVVLVTGAAGLIGSEVTRYFLALGHIVVGIDNNMRREFFGPGGDTSFVAVELSKFDSYIHQNCDIRDFEKVSSIFEKHKPSYIVHAAAQPSHDLAAKIPHKDFHTNATGTLNILEAARNHLPTDCILGCSQ